MSSRDLDKALIKVTDFGLAKLIGPGSMMQTRYVSHLRSSAGLRQFSFISISSPFSCLLLSFNYFYFVKFLPWWFCVAVFYFPLCRCGTPGYLAPEILTRACALPEVERDPNHEKKKKNRGYSLVIRNII